jgi:DNA-binding transcriptional LysR family regulator
MELRHLRYFLATAEEMHFTRAAARLNINQPPLSQQIRDLENEIGAELFRRVGRRIELTEAGQVFLADTRSILEMVERAKTETQRIARGERGSVRIGFTGSACCHPLVPTVINHYRGSHPDVELVLSEGPTSYLVERLREGHIDIGFLRPNPGDLEGLYARVLLHEEVVAAVPAGHALAAKPHIRLRELSGEALVLPPRTMEPLSHDTVLAGCHTAGFKPSTLREVPQAASIINMVATGYGVALVPKSMCQLKPAGVAYVPIEGSAPKVTISVVWREGKTSAAADQFMATIGQVSHSFARKTRKKR